MNKLLLMTSVCGLAALTACASTVSKNVHADGKTADQIVFPDIDKAWHKQGGAQGTFPDIADLRKVSSGITKQQLYQMFGAPQFSEGMFGVREWDYIFQLQASNDAQPTLCQYKVLFDKDYKGQSFYWKPAACGDIVRNSSSDKAIANTRTAYNLDEALLFAFDKSSKSDILLGGKQAVVDLAAKINKDFQSVAAINVVGHADRLGNDVYNIGLSQARAATVRAMLIDQGFDSTLVNIVGVGASQPVARQCAGKTYTPQLASCLQTDRRVEVQVSGIKR